MPYYGPNESSSEIFFEKSFLDGNFVVGVGYGIQLVLYIQCVMYLWQARDRSRRVKSFLLAYVTLLLGLSSLFIAAGVWTSNEIFINNRNYPGGPLAYFLASQKLPENVIVRVALFTVTFLSDFLVLWRCWVVWNSRGAVVASIMVSFPSIILLSSFALGTIWCLQLSQFGPSIYGKVPIAFGTSYFVTSLSVNIVVTVLISICLVMHRRTILNSLPAEYAKHYLSITTIIVESAALYSIFALCFIITYAVHNPLNLIFLSFSSSCQQIAGYLIILRVAQGRAWKTDTLAAGTTAPTIQFSSVTYDEDAEP